MGAGPACTWPFTAAGVVAPKPLPYRTITSPGAAGVPTTVDVAVPIGAKLVCVAATCPAVSNRKNEGATNCAVTLTGRLVNVLLDTCTETCPVPGKLVDVSALICTGLM